MSLITSEPINRAERRRLETRNRLLAAADELMQTVGYHKLSVRAITDHADLGHGTFYLHFQDKDDIVWTIVEEQALRFQGVLDQYLADIPSPRKEYEAWVKIFEFVGQMRELFLSLFGRQGSPVLATHYQDYLARSHLVNLQAQKYQPNVNLPIPFLAQFAAGATMRLLLWWAETETGYTAVDMANMLYEAVYHEPPSL